MHVVWRNGHPHLALPTGSEAARQTLALYQPQRPAGKLFACALRTMARAGFHSLLAQRVELPTSTAEPTEPHLPAITPGSCGIMLGSPEHRIRRAIASYRTETGWEVAKVAIDPEGAEMLAREAATLAEFSTLTSAAPGCLGLHRGCDITILRMPRINGTPVAAGTFREALALLEEWISDLPPRPAPEFPEWNAIAKALDCRPGGPAILERLARMRLTPTLRHGDFARWNLLAQPDGRLIALDWEWGGNGGMPGLDLAHYFLQDARLVRRLAPADAIAATLADLRHPEAVAYLAKTGWDGDPILPVIASLAYKLGAEQQENADMLTAVLIPET